MGPVGDFLEIVFLLMAVSAPKISRVFQCDWRVGSF